MSKTRIQKIQDAMNVAIVASEASHIFCCVLPTLFSIVSLLTGLGLVSTMPYWLEGLHSFMHGWEVPMIIIAGVVVVLGWALYFISKRIDCHDTGCHHGSCEPKKKTASLILKIATVLFLINVTVYFGFHRAMDEQAIIEHVHDH